MAFAIASYETLPIVRNRNRSAFASAGVTGGCAAARHALVDGEARLSSTLTL